MTRPGVFSDNIHRQIYFWSLVLLAVAMPLSEFAMSVAQLSLSANFLLEGKFRQKFRILKSSKAILLFLSVLAVHLIWLWNTSDFEYAFHDIKIKLPLLALPVIFGTSGPLTGKQVKILLLFFTAAVFAGSMVCTSILTGIYPHEYNNIREVSIFISHIRFSLMIVLAVFILIFLLTNRSQKTGTAEKVIYITGGLWLLIFLYLLQALSGIFVFIIAGGILLVFRIFRIKSLIPKLFLLAIIIAGTLLTVSFITRSIGKFYAVEEIDPAQLPPNTPDGNPYWHNTEDKQLENGNYVWLYVCESEMRESWNKTSEFPYDGKDKIGQEIKYTLIRYLTSKGLHKDAEGVTALGAEDILNIENGIANFRYTNSYDVGVIIYKIIWELDIYKKTGQVNNHSITQRIEFLNAAFRIIGKNLWTGVGTGDVKNAFADEYKLMNTKLDEHNQRRAHNQYVTFFVSFGVFGAIYCIFAIFTPYFLDRKKQNLLFSAFFIIIMLSMLNEDTLETQPGITFFMYFYCFFLFAWEDSGKSEGIIRSK
ncbi:MAG: O-antigen ligase family protein [Bacteroidota bacterium]